MDSEFEPPPYCEATMDNFYSIVMEDMFDNMQEYFVTERLDVSTLVDLKEIWLERLRIALEEGKANAARVQAARINNITPIIQPSSRCTQCSPVASHVNKSSEEDNEEDTDLPIPIEETKEIVPINMKFLGCPPLEVKIRVSPGECYGKCIGMVMSFELMEKLREMSDLTIEEATVFLQRLVDAQERDENAIKVWEFKPAVAQNYGIIDGGSIETKDGGSIQERKDGGSIAETKDGDKGICKFQRVVDQNDGTSDDSGSSDGETKMPVDEESKSGENSEDSDEENGVRERDPDSADDMTDDEFEDTDNLILCTYSQIKRHKSHWKFRFDNGIMILDGIEYLFHKATGETIW